MKEIDVVGGVDLPEKYLRTDMIEFDNHPDDELSLHVLRLIGLNLRSMSDEQKNKLIVEINKILGIKPLNSTIRQSEL